MKRLTIILGLVLIATSAVLAYDHHGTKLKGYLIDKMCAGDGNVNKAKGHDKSCALMDHCAESGIALVVEGKVYTFDEAGNKSALELLKNSKRDKGVLVQVEGAVEGTTIKGAKLSEVTE